MKPQLILAVLFVLVHCAVSQPQSQVHRYYTAEGCNVTESLVAEIQIAIIPDGCSDKICRQTGDYWLSVTCNVTLALIDKFSYISRYVGSECNETLLDERVIFNRNTTTACLNVASDTYSIFIDNTCNTNGNITIQRYNAPDCWSDAIESLSASDNTCDGSAYAFCSVDPAPQASPTAPEPESAPSTSVPSTGAPTSTNAPKTNATPKASSAVTIAASFLVISSSILLL